MKLLAFAILNQEVTDLEFNPEPKEGQAMVPGASYIDFRLEKFLKRKKKRGAARTGRFCHQILHAILVRSRDTLW